MPMESEPRMGKRSCKKALKPLLTLMGFMIVLSIVVILPGKASAQAQDSDRAFSALRREIVSRFPDRKTSSYESGQFLSFAAAFLTEHGWAPSLEDYSAVMKSSHKNGREMTYVRVSGQNVVTLGSGANPDAVDLLILAPYDTVISDDVQFPITRPYTTEASAALLHLASELEETQRSSIALALVSGHYQLGAGTEALLESLAAKGVRIKAALVLADMYSSAYLPVVPNNLVDAETIGITDNAVREAGLRSHVARPNDSTWYVTAASGPPGRSVESVLGFTFFPYENGVLETNGILSITIGFPSGDRLVVRDPLTLEEPGPERTESVSSALLAIIGGILPVKSEADRVPAKGMALFQDLGRLIMLPRKTVPAIGLVAALVGSLILVLYRRLLSPESLALWGGIALSGVVSFAARWAAFSSSIGTYTGFVFPVRAFAVWLLIFVGLVLLGFLQMWNVKTRIAHLPRRAVPESTDGRHFEQCPDQTPIEEPQPVSGRPKPTTGSWGLAVMLAVTAGTSLTGSPFFPHSLYAALAMMIAVAIEGEQARRGRSLGLLVWVNRTLYLAPLCAAMLWAGPPTERETMAHLVSGLSKVSPETLASLLSIATSASGLISTFRFPKPAPKSRRGLLVAAIVVTLLVMVTGTYALTTIPVDSLPAAAMAHESYGDLPKLTMVTPRALSQLTTVPGALREDLASFKPTFFAGRDGVVSAPLPPISTFDLATTEVTRLISPTTDTSGESTETASTETSRDVPNEVLVDATLAERPTLLTLEIRDTPLTRSGGASQKLTELFGINSILNVSSPEGDSSGSDGLSHEAEGYVIPRGGTIRIIWWYPQERVLSKQFGVQPSGSTRVDIALEALYVGRSYLGLGLRSPGASIISLTSVARQITIR